MNDNLRLYRIQELEREIARLSEELEALRAAPVVDKRREVLRLFSEGVTPEGIAIIVGLSVSRVRGIQREEEWNQRRFDIIRNRYPAGEALICDMDLPIRVIKTLFLRADVYTLKDLRVLFQEGKLHRVKGLGSTGVIAIKEALAHLDGNQDV